MKFTIDSCFVKKYYGVFTETRRTSTRKYSNQIAEIAKCIYRAKYLPKKLPNYSTNHLTIGPLRN